MKAEIVSVGTELLLGQIVDSNAAILGELFAECGVEHSHRQTVGDNLPRLESALRLALSRSDLVVTIGGLGPTEDDLTRDGIAAALGVPLEEDPALIHRLQEIFAQRNLPWVDSLRRQAMRPPDSEVIDNPNGTAVGLICRAGDRFIVALPGPRSELLPMVRGRVRELLATLGGGQTIVSRILRVAGIGESAVEAALGGLMQGTNPTVAPYAKTAEVHLRLTAKAGSAEAAHALIDPLAAEVRKRLGRAVYGEGETTLEHAMVDELRAAGLTLGTAESLTGGLLAQRLTSVPGVSDCFAGGFVTYAPEAKVRLLGVRQETIAELGTVSSACAMEMAQGARERLGCDVAISLTGEAGPEPAEDKPVGLVFIGLANGSEVIVHEHRFRGSRDDIRLRATQWALVHLRDLGLEGESRAHLPHGS